MQIISNCSKLRSIGFINCEFHLSSTIRKLKRIASLKELNIHNKELTDSNRELLSNMRHLADLEILNIHLMKVVNDEFLKVVAENCKHLTKLKLAGKTNQYFSISYTNNGFQLKYYHI